MLKSQDPHFYSEMHLTVISRL